MNFELFEDIVKMGFIVFCLYAVLHAHAHGSPPARSVLLQRHRLAVVAVLLLAVLALKVTENVSGRESGPIDKALLVFVHAHASVATTTVFEVFADSG